MYVYIKSEPGLWTVGFYSPDGKWNSESDHYSKEHAADRVAYLNGSQKAIKLYLPKEIQFPTQKEEGEMAEKYNIDNSSHLTYVYAGMIMMKDFIVSHLPKRAIDPYPDTEADGFVFCGKCGAKKTI